MLLDRAFRVIFLEWQAPGTVCLVAGNEWNRGVDACAVIDAPARH
jgi:hypothetical protein